MGGRNKSGRDAVGDRLIARIDGEPWRSRLFRRFLETAADGAPHRVDPSRMRRAARTLERIGGKE